MVGRKNNFNKFRFNVFTVLLVLAVVSAGILGVFKISKKIINFTESFRDMRSRMKVIYDMTRDNRSLLVPLEEVKKSDHSFVFVGHIYPFNGVNVDKETIAFLLNKMNSVDPQRVIFGGDSALRSTENSLRYLKDKVMGALNSETRFVLGNHDRLKASGKRKRDYNDLFSKVYYKPYYFEDVDGVRLIYLNSTISFGKYGLDEAQLKFLKNALERGKYKFALVFLHHALWLGRSPHVNEQYTNAQELKETWMEKVLPILKSGKVKAVFSGDGGVNKTTFLQDIEGIPHYLTGWSFNLDERPADFLRIDVEGTVVNVYRYIMLNKRLIRMPIYDKP